MSENYINIEIPHFGKIEIKRFSSNDEFFLFKLIEDKSLSDEEFLINILSKQIQNPKLEYTQLSILPEEALKELGQGLIQANKIIIIVPKVVGSHVI